MTSDHAKTGLERIPETLLRHGSNEPQIMDMSNVILA